MAQDKPYRFGDVVNGHRWTVMGWEPLEPPQVESAAQQPAAPVATVVDDRPTVHYEVGDEANGHRWTGTAWVPVEAADAASSEAAGSEAVSTPDAVGGTGFAPSPPSAGWYPG